MLASILHMADRIPALTLGPLALCLCLAGCAAPKRPLPPPPSPAPAPPSVPIPAPPSRIEPPNFSGLTPDALRAQLGQPQFSRRDGATELWRYDTQTCHAYFFFVGDKVGHVETSPRGPDQGADPRCLISLKKMP